MISLCLIRKYFSTYSEKKEAINKKNRIKTLYIIINFKQNVKKSCFKWKCYLTNEKEIFLIKNFPLCKYILIAL